MTPPYENVYLGNFIFALGYYAANSENGLSDKSVQLVQQTPDEQKLNDLFLAWEGKNYIFEFKRNRLKIKEELKKVPKKRLNEALNDENNRFFTSISSKSHFLGFGLPEGMGFIPYMDIHKEIEKYSTLNQFCRDLVKGADNLGMSHDELVDYLDFIARVTKSKKGGCGGFVLNVSKNGDINMIPFESVEILSQSLDSGPTTPQQSNTPSGP